jgi:phosphate:Na+ symporter
MVGYWIETVIFMFAAIGALLLGFELLSSNITKLCHTSLKKLFNKTQNKAIIGVGIGAIATAIMQSSGATTVMVVGFVNTGLINLAQATALIMGANIGTTITAQLAALSSFDFGAYAILTAGLGAFITMLGKKDRTKTIGNALTGFGILFLGLECMSLAIKNPDSNGNLVVYDTIKNVLQNVNGTGAWIILFLLGIILTALVQSSSLITTIIIQLVGAGIYIGAGDDATCLTNNVLFLILGSNIGSCVTALMSSMGAGTNAKRASVIHLLFNTFGSILFAVLLLLWPNFMEVTFVKWFKGESTQIAMFHTFFNTICTLIFLPFISVFVKTSTALVREKEAKKEVHRLIYIDDRILTTPSVAVHQVRKELALMYSKSVEALNISIDAFLNKDDEKREVVDERIEELEFTNKQIIEFMVKLTNENLAFEDECTLSSFHRTLNDILRIAEIGDNVCKYTKYMVKHELEFSSNVMVQLGFMKNKINLLYAQTDEIFMTKNLNKMNLADALEEEVDQMRKDLIDDHFDRLNRGECKPQNSGVFVNLVNNLERAADHMIYIAYSVKEAKEQAKNK